MHARLAVTAALLSACAIVGLAQSAKPESAAPEKKGGVSLAPKKIDATALRARAAELKRAADSNPESPEAKAAALEEAFTLVKLASEQDPELDARRRTLVERLKKDEAVPKEERVRLTGLSANTEVALNRQLSVDQRMAAYAEVAWGLQKEFPNRPQGYESLVRIARDSNDQQAQRIAEDLIASDAPQEIKREALAILDRVQLIGKSLQDLSAGELPLGTGHNVVCVFTWTVKQPGSAKLAEFLRKGLPPGSTVIGVCLDQDGEAAKSAVADLVTLAEFVFPLGGVESGLCRRLSLEGPQVYITDTEGGIATVSGLNWLRKRMYGSTNRGRVQ